MRNKKWLFILVLLPMLLLSFSQTATAEIGPKIVQGYIKDVNGNPIQCPVVVTLETTGQNTMSDLTGFYRVTFAPEEWSIGDNINVTAQLEGRQLWVNSKCTDGPIDVVNVQDEYEIPEFGPWGFVIAAIVLFVVAIWLLMRKKKK